jgi:hypothetical protein
MPVFAEDIFHKPSDIACHAASRLDFGGNSTILTQIKRPASRVGMWAGRHNVGLGSELGRSVIAHSSVNLIWINALEQHSLFIFHDPEGGGLDASLIQSLLVDFQSLERLESSLLELC